MKNKPISPWANSVVLLSPDRKFRAEIHDAMEIAMGAPTSGVLELNNGRTWDSCNPSIVWSHDSRYLAVPQWTRKRNQKLLIIDVLGGNTYYVKDEYRVLQLESFKNAIVTGIDSPVYKPKKINLELKDLIG